MIRHIVLLAFKKNLAEKNIQFVFSELDHLKQIIPQILTYTWGCCESPENLHKGFLHGFVMEFSTEADRDFYLTHPEHVRVAKDVIFPALENGFESVIVFDYKM
jgi:hypothetical protein